MRKRTVIGTLLTIAVTLLLTGLPAVAADDDPTIDYIDIKPCQDQDPDVIIVNMTGSLVPFDLPVAIHGDWKLIARNTVELEGQPALEWHEREEYLLAKFDTKAVIGTVEDPQSGEELELCLTGNFDNGDSFRACDFVTILKKGNR